QLPVGEGASDERQGGGIEVNGSLHRRDQGGDDVSLAGWDHHADFPPGPVLWELEAQQLGQQPHLVAEVLEQAALSGASGGGDLLGGDPSDALFPDQVQGGLDDPLAGWAGHGRLLHARHSRTLDSRVSTHNTNSSACSLYQGGQRWVQLI